MVWAIFTQTHLVTLSSNLTSPRIGYLESLIQEPILRLLNLQLQRQRCSRLERFSK
jgi:hypothetical protein